MLIAALHDVVPLLTKSRPIRAYAEAPGLRTQSSTELTPSGSATPARIEVLAGRVHVVDPMGLVSIVLTTASGCAVNFGPTLGVGVGVGVGTGVGLSVRAAVAVGAAVAATLGTAVAGGMVAVGIGGVPVAAATSPHPATGRAEPSARSSTLVAGTQPSWATGAGTYTRNQLPSAFRAVTSICSPGWATATTDPPSGQPTSARGFAAKASGRTGTTPTAMSPLIATSPLSAPAPICNEATLAPPPIAGSSPLTRRQPGQQPNMSIDAGLLA
ncbi:MAG: hypothetical protein E6I94_07590 [Chloroflexi bacterium]|nr:MAG: hypothetical protein E6I94_07590 [Chloroflexota bacterium]